MPNIYFPWYYTYRTRVSACFTMMNIEYWMYWASYWWRHDVVWRCASEEHARPCTVRIQEEICKKSDFPSFFFVQLSFLSMPSFAIAATIFAITFPLALSHKHKSTRAFVVCGLCMKWQFYNVHKPFLFAPIQIHTHTYVYNSAKNSFVSLKYSNQPFSFLRFTNHAGGREWEWKFRVSIFGFLLAAT